VRVDPNYFRPAEVDLLLGDYSKAKKALNWEPKVKFKKLCEIMTEADIKNFSDTNAALLEAEEGV
jgi:GDPmannose 4,6-dehydratase